ncbi:hypothetical protein I4F81_009131 [Pyropia yezoensis]|uniref:Uncharacterized protein n=1 Tax=Pyropia yezoensis TaxID=2788 RepID=A0ACC3C9G9_PYRYE|nr:hypothetical protein I4F81_009131 [Neopyropia yezoensis]
MAPPGAPRTALAPPRKLLPRTPAPAPSLAFLGRRPRGGGRRDGGAVVVATHAAAVAPAPAPAPAPVATPAAAAAAASAASAASAAARAATPPAPFARRSTRDRRPPPGSPWDDQRPPAAGRDGGAAQEAPRPGKATAAVLVKAAAPDKAAQVMAKTAPQLDMAPAAQGQAPAPRGKAPAPPGAAPPPQIKASVRPDKSSRRVDKSSRRVDKASRRVDKASRRVDKASRRGDKASAARPHRPPPGSPWVDVRPAAEAAAAAMAAEAASSPLPLPLRSAALPAGGGVGAKRARPSSPPPPLAGKVAILSVLRSSTGYEHLAVREELGAVVLRCKDELPPHFFGSVSNLVPHLGPADRLYRWARRFYPVEGTAFGRRSVSKTGFVTGFWTAEETAALPDLVAAHPHRWTIIGEILSRMPQSVKDKWVSIRGRIDVRTGPFTPDELATLRAAVAALGIPENLAALRVHSVPWTEVARVSMEGRRNARQCRVEWERCVQTATLSEAVTNGSIIAAAPAASATSLAAPAAAPTDPAATPTAAGAATPATPPSGAAYPIQPATFDRETPVRRGGEANRGRVRQSDTAVAAINAVYLRLLRQLLGALRTGGYAAEMDVPWGRDKGKSKAVHAATAPGTAKPEADTVKARADAAAAAVVPTGDKKKDKMARHAARMRVKRQGTRRAPRGDEDVLTVKPRASFAARQECRALAMMAPEVHAVAMSVIGACLVGAAWHAMLDFVDAALSMPNAPEAFPAPRIKSLGVSSKALYQWMSYSELIRCVNAVALRRPSVDQGATMLALAEASCMAGTKAAERALGAAAAADAAAADAAAADVSAAQSTGVRGAGGQLAGAAATPATAEAAAAHARAVAKAATAAEAARSAAAMAATAAEAVAAAEKAGVASTMTNAWTAAAVAAADAAAADAAAHARAAAKAATAAEAGRSTAALAAAAAVGAEVQAGGASARKRAWASDDEFLVDLQPPVSDADEEG